MSNNLSPQAIGQENLAQLKIEQLLELQPKYVDLSLTRIKRLLNALDNPQEKLPPIIHIAGTNGKGSASAFARAFLEAEGKVVHVHTSPHLVHWHERYRIGHKTASGVKSGFVDDAVLAATLEDVSKANQGQEITIFEILTATAFVLFARYPADAVILEVGLGGRYDATNIIPNPAVSLIMSIALDHQAFLGDSIAQIAAEKAGIIKTGAPTVVSQQGEEQVVDIMLKKANNVQAPISLYGRDYQLHMHNDSWSFTNKDIAYKLDYPNLIGSYQVANAAAALQALFCAGFTISKANANQAMHNVVWPARLQHLQHGELLKNLPRNSQVWLDGGHNPAAARELVKALTPRLEGRPFILICGMLTTKDASYYLGAFKTLAPMVYTVAIENAAESLTSQDLAKITKEQGLSASPTSSVQKALEQIATNQKLGLDDSCTNSKAPFILICGSLYLAGEVLKLNNTPPE